MLSLIRQDIAAIQARDPAASSALAVALTYPGFHARLLHRASHWLWQAGATLPAHIVAMVARWLTGIEIHPAATIGQRLFIDHGMGVVIGQTAIIGDDVTLYHGVTLGGISTKQEKRHPTLEDGAIVGAGAHILGAVTVGKNAKIGANAVVLQDVPANATVVGIPARVVKASTPEEAFAAYGIDPACKDPLMKAVEKLTADVDALKARVGLESSKKDTAA